MIGNDGTISVWQFGVIVLAAGIVLVVGALRRWKWLVDPPEELRFFYTQSLYKSLFGTEGCRSLTLVLGSSFIGVGAIVVAIWLF